MVIGDLVLMEVLQGIRDARVLRATDSILRAFTCRDLAGARRARSAALAYRQVRASGVTPRSSIDVLIACFCLEEGLELLATDRDYRLMAPILGFRLWEPPFN
jgi:predicted nucleic acid-binding protein